MMRKTGNYLWRLQKGNPVEWHDGHRKGTGTVVRPYHETTHTFAGQTYKGMPDGFEVRDDVTGEVKLFLNKSLAIPVKKDAK